MNLLDKLAIRYLEGRKGLNPDNGGGYLAGPVPVNAAAIGHYGAGNYSAAYTSNSDLYSVVTFLIRKMASIPWYVYTQKEGKAAATALRSYKMLTSGPMSPAAVQKALILRKAAYDEQEILDSSSGLGKLLAQPNENQGQDQFFESYFGFRILSGEANVWGNSGMDPKGEPVEMLVLPTQFVEDIYDPKDLYGILGYSLNVGKSIPLHKETVVRWKNWRPDFDAATRIHMRGLSIVQVGWKTYLMSDYGAASTAGMLKNGGSKGALTPVPVGNQVMRLDQVQLDMAKRDVNARFNGVDNVNTIGVLAGPYDYLNFGLSAVDMQTLETMKLSLHQWCRMLGMPTVLFDADHTADNNYQNALRDLVTNTVVPMMSSARDQLNKWLLPKFKAEGKNFIDFDVSSLPELQRDIEKLVNTLKAAYWLTEDEKRIMMNYEPKGGVYDTSLVPTGLTPIENIGQDISVDAPEPPAEIDY
jgi:HK97 family phage portal protein